VPSVARAQEKDGKWDMAALVIRISLGTFESDEAAIVEAKLIESKIALETGIRAMDGNLGYYVGIDRRNNAISPRGDQRESASQRPLLRPARMR
jgi:hypothetical protein